MKLSTLSVPYRAVRRAVRLVVPIAFAAFSGMTVLPAGVGAIVAGVIVGSVFLLIGGWELAYYRRFDYELTGETLDIRSGVVARRNREIPLRRVQNVDISRNVLERLLGIAAVSFETAGGGETEATLRYVDFEEAKRLQREVARLKRGGSRTDVEEGTESSGDRADEPDPEELFAVTSRELALLGLLSFDLRVPGLLVLVLTGSVPVLSSFVPDIGLDGQSLGAVLASWGVLVVGVLLFSWAAGATVAVLNFYGFRLDRVGDELQYERGLLRRYDGSIPLEKIQTLTVEDTPLKRAAGYATLRIETAGYAAAGGGGREEAATAVPLATRDRVFALANAIEPFGEPAFERPPARARQRYAFRYLLALGAVTAVLYGLDRWLAGAPSVPAPIAGPVATLAAVPWYAPVVLVPVLAAAAHLKWTHRGWWLGPDHAVTRNGVWRRQLKVVPYYRVQTVIDTRTVFQRRRRLATVTIDTAGSLSVLGSDAAAVDVDAGTADRLRDRLSDRLRRSVLEERERRRAERLRALAVDEGPAREHGEPRAPDADDADGEEDDGNDGDDRDGEAATDVAEDGAADRGAGDDGVGSGERSRSHTE
jgi:putative membrane protein